MNIVEYNMFLGEGVMRLRGAVFVALSLAQACLGYMPADLNHDRTVDFSDFAAFGSYWLENGTETPGYGAVIAR